MSKETTKKVREIVKKHYDFWASYNDIRKDKKTRRIKCMQNGYHHPAEYYKAAAAAIKADLDAAGIKYRDEGFKSGVCWRGDYVYYSLVLPA